jgi:hypothetical protein
MKQVYRFLAYAVAAGVVVQAMLIVYAIGSLQKWVNGGGVYDSSVVDRASAFDGAGAFGMHETIGAFVVPGTVVLLLIASPLAKVRRAVTWAAIMFILVAAQALLGYEAADQPAIGSLHGLFAFLLFAAAIRAGRLPIEAPRGSVTAQRTAPPVGSTV